MRTAAAAGNRFCTRGCAAGSWPEMAAGAGESLGLPVVDLASSDLGATAKSVRKACVEYGFFYVVNHGAEGLVEKVFAESSKFFEQQLGEKMALLRNRNYLGYTPRGADNLDASSKFTGDLNENFCIGPIRKEENFPCWKETLKLYHETALATGKRILSLIALSEANESDDGNYGASAHSDYGILTLLATDGTPGLQICREKDRCPQIWEDVHHIEGALIVNIGDLLQRWTNCVFRSTLHRVVAVGKERYSVAFFLHTNPDLVQASNHFLGEQPEMVGGDGDRLDLPVVDLASSDLRSSAGSIRKACVEYGFFYVVNHGIEEGLLEKVFVESRSRWRRSWRLLRNSSHLGYTPPYAEKLDASSRFRGDLSENFKIGLIGDEGFQNDANQWPSEGEINESDDGNYGASAHSDYGILTLLATDGTPGLQKRNPAMVGGGGGNRLDLLVVDLASSDLRAGAESIRKACVESGFFYVVNHGVEDELLKRLFAESSKFFELPMEEKMALRRNSNHRGYTPPYAEKLDPSSKFEGDLKESFYIGPIGDEGLQNDANQWPSEERLPSWRETIKMYHASALATGKRILSLIALSLNLDAEFFENIGAFCCPSAFLRLLHYPGEVDDSDDGNYGASAHSDYGMITLLATDGTPGLQICREKDRHPQLWEDVHHIDGSTVHRVVAVGKERYSVPTYKEWRLFERAIAQDVTEVQKVVCVVYCNAVKKKSLMMCHARFVSPLLDTNLNFFWSPASCGLWCLD
uniref:Fe2OG dioxygenase domain-containing protein n=1 Tax=Oryza punctata TaxID=4537 RepID=A0A0E0M9X1_ORYPU